GMQFQRLHSGTAIETRLHPGLLRRIAEGLRDQQQRAILLIDNLRQLWLQMQLILLLALDPDQRSDRRLTLPTRADFHQYVVDSAFALILRRKGHERNGPVGTLQHGAQDRNARGLQRMRDDLRVAHTVESKAEPQRKPRYLVPLVPAEQLAARPHQALIRIVREAKGCLLQDRRIPKIDLRAVPRGRTVLLVAWLLRRNFRLQRNREYDPGRHDAVHGAPSTE